MQLTCDHCGREFNRLASVAKRKDRPAPKHSYCCRDCAQAGSRKMQQVGWLNAASEADECYIVGQILDNAVKLRRDSFGSVEWECHQAVHSALLDAAAAVFKVRGKYVPDERSEQLKGAKGRDED